MRKSNKKIEKEMLDILHEFELKEDLDYLKKQNLYVQWEKRGFIYIFHPPSFIDTYTLFKILKEFKVEKIKIIDKPSSKPSLKYLESFVYFDEKIHISNKYYSFKAFEKSLKESIEDVNKTILDIQKSILQNIDIGYSQELISELILSISAPDINDNIIYLSDYILQTRNKFMVYSFIIFILTELSYIGKDEYIKEVFNKLIERKKYIKYKLNMIIGEIEKLYLMKSTFRNIVLELPDDIADEALKPKEQEIIRLLDKISQISNDFSNLLEFMKELEKQYIKTDLEKYKKVFTQILHPVEIMVAGEQIKGFLIEPCIEKSLDIYSDSKYYPNKIYYRKNLTPFKRKKFRNCSLLIRELLEFVSKSNLDLIIVELPYDDEKYLKPTKNSIKEYVKQIDDWNSTYKDKKYEIIITSEKILSNDFKINLILKEELESIIERVLESLDEEDKNKKLDELKNIKSDCCK